MRFSGTKLAHAVTKADRVKRLRFESLSRIGVQFELAANLDWRHDNLRLFKGVANAYADFAGTSLAGRIGQGMAILFMDRAGYAFVGHYPRQANESGPDFVFEHGTGARALVEAKGSFVKPGQRAKIKRGLRRAISELRAARRFRHTKSYAIATCLREVDDAHVEPSLVAFVDPKGASETSRLPSDWIRRENYAAWLDAMRLFESASNLRARRRPEVDRRLDLPTLEIAGRRFALAITSYRPKSERPTEPPRFESWWFWDGFVFDVVGLDIGNLRVIERALTDPSGSALLEIQPRESTDITPSLDQVDGFRGSVLSDGTLLGEIDARVMPGLPSEIVRL